MPTILRLLPILLLLLAGCSRSKHVRRADADAYGILAQKTAGTPWEPPADFDVLPDSRSRFYDPTCLVDPRLPSPAPVLYGYEMPQLATLQNPRAVFAQSSTGRSLRDDPARAQPLEPAAWEPLPASCLRRMLEFESVRMEYEETFPDRPAATPPENRLTLPAIVELALINSRAYQTRKESLYQVALQLSIERYAYQLLFFRRGNGFDVDYSHVRNQGATVNRLAVPSAVGVQRITRHGADVLARFANDIVLTFNGPTGFASQIGSELLFDMSQSVLQRDIIFESLTQAERDVVYAARDFARFRKEFFVDFTRDYYALLLAYRSIEINSLDYFSNQREFRKGEVTFRAGRVSRIQVDQFEQNALRSRSNLVGSCNTLERSLDSLKLRIGVPPEMVLNINLSELDDLTRRDKLAANFQQAARNRENLDRARESGTPELSVQLNSAKRYTQNLVEALVLRSQGNVPGEASESGSSPRASDNEETLPPGAAPNDQEYEALQGLLLRFSTLEALSQVAYTANVLRDDLKIQPPVAPLRLSLRRFDLARALLEAKRLQVAEQSDGELGDELLDAVKRTEQLDLDLRASGDVATIDKAVAASAPLLKEVRDLVGIDSLEYSRTAIAQRLTPLIDSLLELGDRFSVTRANLPEVDISVDDAMLTAATQRLDLANAREQLADAWRQIKLRGDDLRAIVRWRFRHALRTPSNRNRPFNFTFDESDTRLSFSFDAPLNRLIERNAFRFSLINYNRSLRELIQLEDEVKLDVRNDLRDLELDRNQYEIAVASAALASERVYSTRLRFDQGVGSARDWLEAQQAFTESLNAVAREHIGYLVDRTQLFLALEQLQVDELGYWQDLYNDDAQPLPRFDMPQYSASIYGDLPWVKYSACIRRMLSVPTGNPRVNVPPSDAMDVHVEEQLYPPSVDSVPLESIEAGPVRVRSAPE